MFKTHRLNLILNRGIYVFWEQKEMLCEFLTSYENVQKQSPIFLNYVTSPSIRLFNGLLLWVNKSLFILEQLSKFKALV